MHANDAAALSKDMRGDLSPFLSLDPLSFCWFGLDDLDGGRAGEPVCLVPRTATPADACDTTDFPAAVPTVDFDKVLVAGFVGFLALAFEVPLRYGALAVFFVVAVFAFAAALNPRCMVEKTRLSST